MASPPRFHKKIKRQSRNFSDLPQSVPGFQESTKRMAREIEPYIRMLGSRINILSISEVVQKIDVWIKSAPKFCKQVVVTGFHGIWEAYKHPELKNILNSADLWIPDGIAPVWAARYKDFPDAQRTPGPEIMKAFFKMANDKRYKSFFYGDTEEILADLKDKMGRNYPKHQIVGTFSPPFRSITQQEDEQIIRMINDAKPDVLWVALGMPKQDRWIFEHKEKLHVPVAIGVGAAFRFLSEHVKRAPRWVGDSGFEWVWRLLCQPRKLWRRELIDVPQFVALAFLELIGFRKYD